MTGQTLVGILHFVATFSICLRGVEMGEVMIMKHAIATARPAKKPPSTHVNLDELFPVKESA